MPCFIHYNQNNCCPRLLHCPSACPSRRGSFLVLLHSGLAQPVTETMYLPPVPPLVGTTSVPAEALPLMDPLPLCQVTVPHLSVSAGSHLVLCGDIPELGR